MHWEKIHALKLMDLEKSKGTMRTRDITRLTRGSRYPTQLSQRFSSSHRALPPFFGTLALSTAGISIISF